MSVLYYNPCMLFTYNIQQFSVWSPNVFSRNPIKTIHNPLQLSLVDFLISYVHYGINKVASVHRTNV